MKQAFFDRIHRTIAAGIALVDDRQASEGALLFPRLKGTGELIPAGTRINWQGSIRRAAVDLWDTEQNTPGNAPNLWEEIAYRDGYRMIPQAMTAAQAFALDECGWWEGNVYRSLRDGNVYSPSQTPEWWQEVDA